MKYSLSAKTLEESYKIYGECTGDIYNDTMEIIDKIKSKGGKIYLLSNLKEIDFNYLKQKLDIKLFDNAFLSFKLGCIKSEN